MKEHVKSENKPPKSAMALYIKIYSQKKGRLNNRQNSLEAIKSWISLNKSDKKYFISVFKDYESKINKCFASNLQNAQLYMKKLNHTQRLPHNKTTPIASDLNSCEEILSDKIDEDRKDDKIEICHNNEQSEVLNSTIHSESETFINRLPEEPRIFSEPTPPVSSSKELFELIKYDDDTTKNVNWADLTKLQKQRYQRALLTIKQNYIKQYTIYLEQMTPEQLFHHYQSKLN